MASVAINGLGRIGRAAVKIIEDIDGADVVAVNDLIPPDNLAYLLRYDTVHGRYHKTVTATGDSLIIGGRPVPVLASRDPTGLPWADVGVDLVLECNGAFRREDDLKKHLAAGAAGDLVGARSHGGGGDGGARGDPGTGGETGDLVRELPDQLHYPGRRGTGPPVRRAAGDHGHGARLHVLPAADRRAGQGLPPRPRRHREHAARFHRCRAGDHQGPARPGRAVRRGGGPVPIPAGSIADVVAVTARPASREEVNGAFREEAASDRYRGILGVAEDPVVSAGIIGDSRPRSWTWR